MSDIIAKIVTAVILISIIILANVGIHVLFIFEDIWYIDVAVMFFMFMLLDFAYFLRDN